MRTDEKFIAGSGNVFADLGLPDADIELAKAILASTIRNCIRARGLTQQDAAILLDIDQSKISAIMKGKVSGYTYDRLLRYLNKFNRDVTLVIGPEKADHSEGQTLVEVG